MRDNDTTAHVVRFTLVTVGLGGFIATCILLTLTFGTGVVVPVVFGALLIAWTLLGLWKLTA